MKGRQESLQELYSTAMGLLMAYEESGRQQDLMSGMELLRKAIGWALRDYARTDPDWVRAFVATHPLSPLSVREATKHL